MFACGSRSDCSEDKPLGLLEYAMVSFGYRRYRQAVFICHLWCCCDYAARILHLRSVSEYIEWPLFVLRQRGQNIWAEMKEEAADSPAWRRIQPHLFDLTSSGMQQYCLTFMFFILLRVSLIITCVSTFAYVNAANHRLCVSSNTFAWLS